jgi:SAM-dependent methyltransferase
MGPGHPERALSGEDNTEAATVKRITPMETHMDSRFWDERYDTADMIWTTDANRFLVEIAGGLEPGRALDLACGEGRNTVWLAERGWTATGVDFSPVGLAKASRLAEARGVEITLLEADATTWRPAPQSYDLVCVLYLQLASPAREAALEAALEALCPGGTLLVVAHDVENIIHGVGGPQDPSVCYSAEGVVNILGDLTVLEAGPRNRPVTGVGGDVATAIDTVVVARRPH